MEWMTLPATPPKLEGSLRDRHVPPLAGAPQAPSQFWLWEQDSTLKEQFFENSKSILNIDGTITINKGQ